jgi:hypothetical protein
MSRIAVGSILLIFILVACATSAESPASPRSVVTESPTAQVVATEAISPTHQHSGDTAS